MIVTNISYAEDSFNKCNNFSDMSIEREEKELKNIFIKVNNHRGWQVNNIRILTNNSHVIPNKFKKKFNAEIKAEFSDKTYCTFKAKIRAHGDLKDHIYYEDGKVFQSLDVHLISGNINNITKFKLFLKGTRGADEDEIFMTELLREFNYLAPRTQFVKVDINDFKLDMIFQEKITKELLEYNYRREGPILEGDEKYMMRFISSVKNNPSVNWNEIFKKADLSSKLQLAKQTNSSWSMKNRLFKEISLDALEKLNFVYLVYLNNFKDDKNNYLFTDYYLDNFLLAQKSNINENYLNIYNNLILAANGAHGLYVHNRKFYWNSIEGFFEPIYYDGEFNIKKEINKLNYPISKNYLKSLNNTINLLESLNTDKFYKNSKLNFYFERDDYDKKINLLFKNLANLKKLFLSKDKNDILYNLNIYKNKDLQEHYLKNLNQQNINIKFSKYDFNDKENLNIYLCDNKILNCNKKVELNQSMTREYLEGKLVIDDYDYQFAGNLNINFDIYNHINLNNKNFKDVKFFFNSGINYNYNEDENIFKVDQKMAGGKGYFIGGEIKNISIIFNGLKDEFNKKNPNKYDYKTLTGCLSFIKNNFKEVNIKTIYSTCEDGINIINSVGYINTLDSSYSLFDGIDLDFSNLTIKNVNIFKANNDCIDFSTGKYSVENFELNQCGDKAISVGEKTTIKINNVLVSNANIGIASKDSSLININKSNITNTKECLAAYKKKQEYGGAYLKIKQSKCLNYYKKSFQDNFSKIEINKES